MPISRLLPATFDSDVSLVALCTHHMCQASHMEHSCNCFLIAQLHIYLILLTETVLIFLQSKSSYIIVIVTLILILHWYYLHKKSLMCQFHMQSYQGKETNHFS